MPEQPGAEGWLQAPATHTRLPTASSGENRFVGREAEIRELLSCLDDASRGNGRSVLIAGDAGIGKTRLAWEFTLQARSRSALVLWGRCWEAGGAPPFWPWIDILRQLNESEVVPSHLPLGRHTAYLIELVPELAARLTPDEDTPARSNEPDSARFQMFDAVVELLRKISTIVPLVVVIDDLHAADQSSLALLAFLARRLRDEPILVIGTIRDPDATRGSEELRALAELARQSDRLALHGLSHTEVGLMIESSAGREPSEDLARRIHRITEGNPFFVDEIAHLLADESSGIDGTLPRPFCLPYGIRDAVRRRLEPLASECVELLEIASVVGREFDLTTLQLVDGRDRVEILNILDAPIRLGLVAEVSRGRGLLQFQHTLTREVLYEGLAATRRLEIHRHLAESIEALHVRDSERVVDALAHHFLISAPHRGDARAIEYGTKAAQRALSRMAFHEAVALNQQALDALAFVPAGERTRCTILLALGTAKEWANDIDGSRAAFYEAAAIARQLRDAGLLAEAALGVGAVHAIKITANTRCDAAPDLIVEALDSIDPEDSRLRARLLSRLALHQMTVCAREDALGTSRRAVETARVAPEPGVLSEVLLARNAVLIGPDLIDERAAIAAEMIDLGKRTRSRALTMRGQALSFTVQFELGNIAAADLALNAHERLAAESNDPFERWANLVWRGERALLEGRFDEAETYAHRAHDLSKTTPGPHAQEPYGSATFVGQMIMIEDTRGDSLPDLGATLGYRAMYPEVSTWQIVGLALYTRLGRLDDAAVELERVATNHFRNIERNGLWLATLSYVSDAIELLQDRDRAKVVYDLLLPFAYRNVSVGHVGSRGSMSRWLGSLAVTLQDLDAAEVHFSDALSMNRRMGAQPQIALTAFAYAQMRSLRGNSESARLLFAEARRHAAALGMSLLAARCEAALERISSKSTNHAIRRDERTSLRKSGNVWMLEFDGSTVHLTHTKGVVYLGELIRQPGVEVHAVDLMRLVSGDDPLPTPTFSQPLTDTKARREYSHRLIAATTELERAERDGDPEAIVTLRREVDAIGRELARATGIGGRPRKSSDAERARISVTRAIRLALAQVHEANPSIGRSLSACVRTGTFCCFSLRQ